MTALGTGVAREWPIDMLATAQAEFPRFPAALSFIFGLAPDAALAVLEQEELAETAHAILQG